MVWCKYCGSNRFKDINGLNQHQSRHQTCSKLKELEEGKLFTPKGHESDSEEENEDELLHLNDDYHPPNYSPAPAPKKGRSFRQVHALAEHDMDAVTEQVAAYFDNSEASEDEIEEEKEDCYTRFEHIKNKIANSDPGGTESEGSDSDPDDLEEDLEEPDLFSDDKADYYDDENQEKAAPNTFIRDDFRDYCNKAPKTFMEFTSTQICAIRLVATLHKKKAPLNAYESLMDWHIRSLGGLKDHEVASDSPLYIGRKALIKMLAERYNFEHQFPFQKILRLPVSGTLTRVTCHEFSAVLQRLLTNPRIKEKDYLFHKDHPLAGPPDDLDYVADLNTGRGYIVTWQKLVTEEGEQAMPVIVYIDGSAVTHFHDFEIIPVKVSLGIFTKEARMQDHFWATLGYIEKVHKVGGRGDNIMATCHHLEDQDLMILTDPKEIQAGQGIGQKDEQDVHAMLDVILEGLVEIQETGFYWDLPYKGETHTILYKTFVPFVKCDTKEADLLCGKYQNRTSAQQICRYCHCKTEEADDHLHKPKPKTKKEIRKLVKDQNLDGLKKISQHYLLNAFWKVRFSAGVLAGIHGSCPSEMLHALLLGIFKYTREIFFDTIGKDGAGGKDMNALAQLYCDHYRRQSDRTRPPTNFSKGIQAGKMMAKEYRGILLLGPTFSHQVHFWDRDHEKKEENKERLLAKRLDIVGGDSLGMGGVSQ